MEEATFEHLDYTDQQLISELREYAVWAYSNQWEIPIILPDLLNEAAERLQKHITA